MSEKLQILSENIQLPNLDWERIEMWLRDVASLHGRIFGELTYIFCDDSKILEVNRQFLDHDYFTDIITFDYTRGKLVRGDIYISLDTVLSNSQLVGSQYDTELLRVIVHGLLHLCGINDKGPGEREIMEQNEDQAIKIYYQKYA